MRLDAGRTNDLEPRADESKIASTLADSVATYLDKDLSSRSRAQIQGSRSPVTGSLALE